MWFQCPMSATMDVLHEKFPDMVISRGDDVNWPPRSCEVTPLDFFCGVFLSRRSMSTSRKPPMLSKSTYATPSIKYSPICTPESSKIGLGPCHIPYIMDSMDISNKIFFYFFFIFLFQSLSVPIGKPFISISDIYYRYKFHDKPSNLIKNSFCG